MSKEKLQEVAERFEGAYLNGDGYVAKCPVHDDENPSLSIHNGKGGKILVHCHAGCDVRSILKEVGLTFADLGEAQKKVVAAYNYLDEEGNLLYQTVRLDPKDFKQRSMGIDGKWRWTTKGVRKILYRLPELMSSGNRVVYIVEGEKDVDRVVGLGLVATTNVGGAGKWREEYGGFLRGRRVIILPDNDGPGRKHAEKVAGKLAGLASSIKVLQLPGLPEKGDVSDWIDKGGTVRSLMSLVRKTEEFIGEGAEDDDRAIPFNELSARHPELREPVINKIARVGETINIVAPSKVGKSWLAWNLALCVSNGRPWFGRFSVKQGKVLYIDNELHKETIAHRGREVARALGMNTDAVDVKSLRGNLMDYYELKTWITQNVKRGDYLAIIIDAHYRMVPGAISENDNSGMKDVYNLIDGMAEHTASVWVLIHHSSKGDQAEKGVTDVGAGAGSQSRASDTHLILRRHKEEGAYILEAAIRSFEPLKPIVLRWQFPVWVPDKNLDPGALEMQEDRKQRIRDEHGKGKILKILKTGPATINALRSKTGMRKERISKLLTLLIGSKKVVTRENEERGIKEYYCAARFRGASPSRTRGT